MSPDNLRLSVADELANAERLLRAAEALFSLGLWPDAVNRAYYCVYHLTRALLLLTGDDASTHAGVKGLLGLRLVRTGQLPERAASIFASLERGRSAADYRRFVTVTEDEARAAVTDAREFDVLARALLRGQGLA